MTRPQRQFKPGYSYYITTHCNKRLQDDGLTQWHPAFLQLGVTLDLCAAIYRKFCQQYRPQAKPPRKNNWGSQLLSQIREKMKAKKVSPGQKTLWDEWQKDAEEIHGVAKKFVLANCFNPKVAEVQFHSPPSPPN